MVFFDALSEGPMPLGYSLEVEVLPQAAKFRSLEGGES